MITKFEAIYFKDLKEGNYCVFLDRTSPFLVEIFEVKNSKIKMRMIRPESLAKRFGIADYPIDDVAELWVSKYIGTDFVAAMEMYDKLLKQKQFDL